jgi:hypothetical protein
MLSHVSDSSSVVIEERGYLRVQTRIRNEMGNSAASIWLAVSFTFLGTALSTLVTWLVTPTHMAGMPAGSNSTIGVAAIGSTLLSIVSGLAHLTNRRSSRQLARDICEEMDTYSSRGQ